MRAIGDVKPGAVALHDPLVPTRPTGDFSNAIATTAFVRRALNGLAPPVVGLSPPVAPCPGQLWWSTKDGQLYIWIGKQWVAASCCEAGVTVSIGLAPPNKPAEGDLWWDAAGDGLFVWVGNGWVAATCCTSGSGSGMLFTALTDGIVPASGGGTVNFLRADRAWVSVVQPSGGTMTGPLLLAADPTVNLEAVTKQYCDNLIQLTDDKLADYLPLAGGTMTGPIELTAPPATSMEVANKGYVDEAIAAGALYQGTWEADTNVPDLTNTVLHINGYAWVAITPDPQQPFTITAALPGLQGVEINNGDRIVWSDAAAEFQLVRGSTLSLAEAEQMFVPFTGGTLTGPLLLAADPTANLGAATKQYVDTADNLLATVANGRDAWNAGRFGGVLAANFGTGWMRGQLAAGTDLNDVVNQGQYGCFTFANTLTLVNRPPDVTAANRALYLQVDKCLRYTDTPTGQYLLRQTATVIQSNWLTVVSVWQRTANAPDSTTALIWSAWVRLDDLISRPFDWATNVEIDFGNGLRGFRATGFITQIAGTNFQRVINTSNQVCEPFAHGGWIRSNAGAQSPHYANPWASSVANTTPGLIDGRGFFYSWGDTSGLVWNITLWTDCLRAPYDMWVIYRRAPGGEGAQLPVPDNIEINGNILTWDAVPDALQYAIRVNGITRVTNNTTRTYTLPATWVTTQTHSVQVMAVARNNLLLDPADSTSEIFRNSPWSTAINYGTGPNSYRSTSELANVFEWQLLTVTRRTGVTGGTFEIRYNPFLRLMGFYLNGITITGIGNGLPVADVSLPPGVVTRQLRPSIILQTGSGATSTRRAADLDMNTAGVVSVYLIDDFVVGEGTPLPDGATLWGDAVIMAR